MKDYKRRDQVEYKRKGGNRVDVRKLNRNLIELAVSQGIREIRQDTKRGLRRLSDLGQHFAGRWFSQNIFIQIHDILKQDDSRYYQLIKNCLDSIDEEALKTFGINLGYNSWTCGVSRIRKSIQEGEPIVSWYCELPYKGDRNDSSSSLQKLYKTVEEKRRQGVFTFLLYPQQTFSECPEMIFVLDEFPDCAFLCFFKESDLTNAEIKILGKHKNSVYLFSALKEDGSPNTEIGEKLKEQKILYSYYYIYEEMDGGLEGILAKLQGVLEKEPAALIMKAGDSVSEEYRRACAKEIWKKRMIPQYTTFLIELSEDGQKIDELIAGK